MNKCRKRFSLIIVACLRRLFFKIIATYLKSKLVGSKEGIYVQKSGICIGFKFALILSDLYLIKIDKQLEDTLGNCIIKYLRYADDYLMCFSGDDIESAVTSVSEQFELNEGGLNFTKELPENDVIHFLDISVAFQKDHICWQYSLRSSKPLINILSKHSKIVKNAIAMLYLKSSLTKSCEHKMSANFNAQVKRLVGVG